MSYNARLNPRSFSSEPIGSVATDGSSATLPIFSPSAAGQVIAARFINGNTATVASGTTAGSALNVYVYKTASSTDSQVASAALGAVATLATATLTMSTSTALTRFTDGSVYCCDVIGGAGNDNSNAGARIQIDVMYAQAATDDATP